MQIFLPIFAIPSKGGQHPTLDGPLRSLGALVLRTPSTTRTTERFGHRFDTRYVANDLKKLAPLDRFSQTPFACWGVLARLP
jgi:hypothetical protein